MRLKKIITNGIRYLLDSDYRFLINSNLGKYNGLPDLIYLKKMFKVRMHQELDFNHPVTFNQKLQWLKIYDRNLEYVKMVDKYEVRNYIAEKLGEEYLIPLLGVWEHPEEIDFSTLPNQFVLKCNHNSGLGMCICKNKSVLDIDKVKKDLKKGLKQDYYLTGREWPYKDVPRKIIAEKYMVDNESGELNDYKFFCFNGNVDCVMVCLERSSGNPKYYFFDSSWKLLRYNKLGKNAPKEFILPKPKNIEEMFSIARTLSEGIPFSRIDLYSVEGKTYFGEITFFPDSGFDSNLLPETDSYWGKMLILPKIKQREEDYS